MSNESKSGKKLKIALIIIAISLIISVYANANFYKRIYGYNGLESQIADLQDEKNSLSTERDNLKAKVRSLVSERDNLVTDLTSLTQQMDKASANITTLESEITQLQQDYDDLLSDYDLINGPVSTFDTIDDLQIEISTDKSIYSYTDSISGHVKIYYINDAAFQGSFSIEIKGEFTTGGAINYGQQFTVNGEGSFLVESPYSFHYGPGDYSVYISSIYDLDGYVVAGGPVLRDNVKVSVEAK